MRKALATRIKGGDMPTDDGSDRNNGETGKVVAGPIGARPVAGEHNDGDNRVYLATDTGERFHETATGWETMAIDAPAGRFETVRTDASITARTPVYDVRAWGATGNGETDDTEAIQAALDAASEAGGGVIRLPPGRYRITYTLLYGSATVIEGHGATIAFDPSSEDATALVSRGFDGSGTTRDVTISGLDVESVDPGKGNGIGVAKAERVTVQGCRTERLHWHLVDVAGAKDVVVRDCYAANLATAAYQADNLTEPGGLVVEWPDGTTESAIDDGTENENVDIEGNIAEDCARGVHLHRSGGHDLTVRENKFRRCTGTGILGDVDTHWHDVIVSDNIVEGNGSSSGIDLQGEYTNLSIENNTVRNHDHGITVRPGTNAGGRPDDGIEESDDGERPEPNTQGVTDGGETDTAGERATIAAGVTVGDNTVAQVGRRAISLAGVSGHVSDNYVHEVSEDRSDERALHTDGDESEDSGNDATGTDSERVGITVDGCSAITVTDNVLRAVVGIGVLVEGASSDAVIAENNVSGFDVAVALRSEVGGIDGADVKDNRFVGSGRSAWAVTATNGSGIRIEDNAVAGVGRGGVRAIDVRDLHVGNNDATGRDARTGYAIESCSAVELHDNTATGFATPVSLTRVTDAYGVLGDLGVDVGSDCQEATMILTATEPPESGAFGVGSRVENANPEAGGSLGWICTESGTPGTWKPYGTIGT
jgi:hypothetical protein